MNNIKKIVGIVLFFITGIFINKTNAQLEGCYVVTPPISNPALNCASSSPVFIPKYYNLTYNIPNETNPEIKTVMINFEVVQKSDGTGNYITDDLAGRTFLNEVFSQFAYRFQFNCLPSDPLAGVIHRPDTYIRFELNTYFIKNTNVYNNYMYDSYMLDYLRNNYPDRMNQVNIFFTGQPVTQHAWSPMPGIDFYDQCITMGHVGNSNVYANVLSHEMGHILDLFHTYENGCETCDENSPDYLSDVFGLDGSNTNCWLDGGWECDPYEPTRTCTNNMMGGWKDACYFSPMQIGKMHRALTVKSVSRYIKPYYFSTPLTITNSETWDFGMRLFKDVVIEPGVTLTLKCKLRMAANTRIIVKPGAKLIIDGGKIFSGPDPNILWQGIEVQGNTYLSQTNQNQGYVELLNNARIENAYCAIYTAKLNPNGTADPGGYGGIVKVDNSYFYNNFSSINICKYYNLMGVPQPNISFVNNTIFEVDTDLFSTIETLPAFINLELVAGIKMRNNVFKNTCSSVPYANRNYGIKSRDASYTLYNINSFYGLQYGVKSLSTTTLLAPTIDHAYFNYCYRSIYLSGNNNPTVTFCNFTVPSDNNKCYGLYLDNCPTFNVQENSFIGAGTVNGDFGIIINNCGETSKKIYNNVFSNINVGTQAQNKNRNSSGTTGLQILCNTYYNNEYDIKVMSDQVGFIVGIAQFQGRLGLQSNDPAGNLFSHNAMDYSNSLRSNVTYYHHRPSSNTYVLPNPVGGNITLTNTNVIWTSKPNCCPQEFTEGLGDIAGLKSSIVNSQSQVNNTNIQLQTLVDGGNTSLLETQVETSPPSQALLLRNKLLSTSPFLSDSVMVSAINNEDGLPPVMLTQVLVQNPSGAKSPVVLDELENRVNPLPEYMMQQILAGQNRLADKEKLETKVCCYTLQRDMAWDKIARIYKNDSIHPWANDSLISLLGSDPRLMAKYELVFARFAKNQNNEALQLLGGLPQNYVMDESQAEEFNDYLILASIFANLKENNKTWKEMSNVQKQALLVIANKQKNTADMLAVNIMCMIDKYNYNEPILLDEVGGGKMLFGIGATNPNQPKSSDVQFKVYPNPANDYFLIDYKLTEENNDIKVEIRDITGKMIKSTLISDIQNQLVIETKGMINGIYFVCLVNRGAVIKHTKLTIVN